MDAILERACELKQDLIEFVLDAEGELAESLELYVANKSRSQSNRHNVAYNRIC